MRATNATNSPRRASRRAGPFPTRGRARILPGVIHRGGHGGSRRRQGLKSSYRCFSVFKTNLEVMQLAFINSRPFSLFEPEPQSRRPRYSATSAVSHAFSALRPRRPGRRRGGVSRFAERGQSVTLASATDWSGIICDPMRRMRRTRRSLQCDSPPAGAVVAGGDGKLDVGG